MKAHIHIGIVMTKPELYAIVNCFINRSFLFKVIITVISEPECKETDIRLMDGAAANEGRVEICHSGLWRSICDNDWRVTDSQVVCRQLGYGSEYCWLMISNINLICFRIFSTAKISSFIKHLINLSFV